MQTNEQRLINQLANTLTSMSTTNLLLMRSGLAFWLEVVGCTYEEGSFDAHRLAMRAIERFDQGSKGISLIKWVFEQAKAEGFQGTKKELMQDA